MGAKLFIGTPWLRNEQLRFAFRGSQCTIWHPWKIVLGVQVNMKWMQGYLCYLCLVLLMLSRLFIAALWLPAGKGLTSWLLLVMFIVFLAHLSRRLRGELLVYQWLRRPSSVRPSVNIFKHLLLWNHWANWTQISYGDSLGWGNESLFKWSWSHDQDGRHAHIW